MKVLFGKDVLEDVLTGGACSADAAALLNMCQDGRIRGYICTWHLLEYARELDVASARTFLSVSGSLYHPLRVNTRDIRNALEYDDFEIGLYSVLVMRHRLDCAVIAQKNRRNDSTIKLYVPKELRRMIENGKTAQQRRNL